MTVYCSPDGHSQEAQDAADKAIQAHRKAENAQIRIQDIMDRLPEDKRKVEEIPRDIDDANRDIRKAQAQGMPSFVVYSIIIYCFSTVGRNDNCNIHLVRGILIYNLSLLGRFK